MSFLKLNFFGFNYTITKRKKWKEKPEIRLENTRLQIKTKIAGYCASGTAFSDPSKKNTAKYSSKTKTLRLKSGYCKLLS